VTGFRDCPRCGLRGDCRTSCACGYALRNEPEALPSAPMPSEPAPSHPGEQIPGRLRRPLLVLACVTVCAVGLWFLGAKTRWFRRQPDLGDVGREEMNRQKEAQAAEAERKNRDTIARLQQQRQRLRDVRSDAEAEQAVAQAERQVLIAARLRLPRPALPGGDPPAVAAMHTRMPGQLLKQIADHRGANAAEVTEAAEALSSELLRVAAEHPRAFEAAYRKAVPQPRTFSTAER